MKRQYALLDSGSGRKLEQFGSFILSRPCSQAVWSPKLSSKTWQEADALFEREGDKKWTLKNPSLNNPWEVEVSGIKFKLDITDFGHLGIFPEQADFWEWIQKKINSVPHKESLQVLNLFAYSGGSTLAAAKAGAQVCHLDASKGMVSWARENAALNKLENAPIRWIVDDVNKFLQRELRREKKYDAIILDPPSFGRGTKGEVFKIEEEIVNLLQLCRQLLSHKPLFVLFSCHTPGFSPTVMHHLLSQATNGLPGRIESGEMLLKGSPDVLTVPSGTFARWSNA